jgi:AcrR family transcriptional regulator
MTSANRTSVMNSQRLKSDGQADQSQEHSDVDRVAREAIKVRCKRANVGRSTFYAHFTSKDDLKRRGLEHLRQELIEQQRNASSGADTNVRGLAFTLTMFEHAHDHIHHYRALVGSRGGAIALTTIRQTLCEIVRGELAEIGNKDSYRTPRELAVQYIVGAYMAVLTWWLDGGAKLPPQRINVMFQSLATDGIASLGR